MRLRISRPSITRPDECQRYNPRMNRPRPRVVGLLSIVFLLVVENASAVVCMNKFLRRTEGTGRQIVTLLTGKLTFEEAQARVKGAPFEWVDDKGKVLAKSLELKAVRPMPVGCDGKTSGVVMIATFMSINPPKGKMLVQIDRATKVAFEEQAE